MTPNSLWFKVFLKILFTHNTILSSKGTLFWWGRPPGHTHHLEHARRFIFVCGAMLFLHLCTLKLVSFPARLTPTGSRSRTPQEMKEGSENLNPIIFGQLGPF